MKKSSPDQPRTDHLRLSPTTQADGDLFRSSRRPNADSSTEPRPVSLSESNLHVHEKQQQQKQQKNKTKTKDKQKQEQEQEQEQNLTAHSASTHSLGHPFSSISTQDGRASGLPSGDSGKHTANHTANSARRNNTRTLTGTSASGSTSTTVSPAAVSPASLQDARAGPVIDREDVGGEKGGGPDPSADPTLASATNANALPSDDGQTEQTEEDKRNKLVALVISFFVTTKQILFHSWLNVFLVFVPAGIIVAAIPNCPPAVVFSLNAIAIVPLAGLLGLATETVAHRMGDSIGALLNITFGNAVELIIFIALVKNQIRIVQASLLGSILANLLLILGMGFLLGGLRFREQIYNSTVTQMSACLLSLSVISLVLPTAFHASFSDTTKADIESLKISRGTSVVLLLVYGIYLLFQLKSHAYMYESTPQHIIDEESTPGPAAAWLDSSSSDDSSSSSSDSDGSGHSRDTMRKRMRRVIRGGRRRKSSVASLDTADSIFTGPTRTPSFSTVNATNEEPFSEESSSRPALVPRLTSTDMSEEAIEEDASHRHRKHRYKRSLRHYRRNRKRSGRSESNDHDAATEDTILEGSEVAPQISANVESKTDHEEKVAPVNVLYAKPVSILGANSVASVANGETRRVDFAIADPVLLAGDVDEYGNPPGAAADLASARRAFNLRAMSLRPVAKSLAPTVFTQPAGAPPAPAAATGPIPRVRYGIRRTNSLPDRLNQYQFRPPGAMLPSQIPAAGLTVLAAKKGEGDGEEDSLTLSRKAAVLMLLLTTGLVAVCAEFMVSSINGLVATSSVGEVFIGLIILPIVGNAAEHVTAVMVAMKNKMDLAIGVAVGSSIQIALFMTPLVVILGWIIGRDMTLYFTLFETVCLFVSAFIVNFLVLDGRSNYLEGALLCATYVIIGLVAFYYPSTADASSWG